MGVLRASVLECERGLLRASVFECERGCAEGEGVRV